MAIQYSKKVLDHFLHPRNQGSLKNPDGVGTVGNPKCGDIMRLAIKVTNDKKGDQIIKAVKFETLGCGAAIATSSMATELAKGKTLEEAMKITNHLVAKELGDLPKNKLHCSNLAADALHKAIEDFRGKSGAKKTKK